MSIFLSWKTLIEVLSGRYKDGNYLTMRALLRNKVLYFAGLVNVTIRNSNEWQELARRRNLQLQALREFAEIAEKIGLQYVVIKTFKLFPYVPDDVDILVLNNDAWNDLILELIAKGYYIRSIGTSEMTVRKVRSFTCVDLDLHHKVAAGEYVYYNNDNLWHNRRELEIGDVKIPVASWEDECLLTISHAVMKEFEVLASDLLQVLLGQRKGYIKLDYLHENGHLETYRVFIRSQRRIISKGLCLPYRIPIWEVLHAYVHHLNHRLKRDSFSPLKELVQFPKARGIKRLLSFS
jgi:hypothetical protein